MVGISGLFVNSLVLWMITDGLNWPYQLGGLIAIQIAIINNYIWNRRFTWRDRLKTEKFDRFWSAMGQFTLVSWFAGSINWVLLIALTELLHLHYMLSNLMAILVASVINYLANDQWTFRNRDQGLTK